eukprot:763954_1
MCRGRMLSCIREEDDLIFHLQNSHNIKCPYCGTVVPNKREFEKHAEKSHKDIGSTVCSDCLKVYTPDEHGVDFIRHIEHFRGTDLTKKLRNVFNPKFWNINDFVADLQK